MNLLMIPWLALKALRQNVLRTALTMLGIIIGVGAVICVVAIGEGAAGSVERDAAAKRLYVGYGSGALSVLDPGDAKRLAIEAGRPPGIVSARTLGTSRIHQCADNGAHRRRRPQLAEGGDDVACGDGTIELPDGAR